MGLIAFLWASNVLRVYWYQKSILWLLWAKFGRFMGVFILYFLWVLMGTKKAPNQWGFLRCYDRRVGYLWENVPTPSEQIVMNRDRLYNLIRILFCYSDVFWGCLTVKIWALDVQNLFFTVGHCLSYFHFVWKQGTAITSHIVRSGIFATDPRFHNLFIRHYLFSLLILTTATAHKTAKPIKKICASSNVILIFLFLIV